MCATKDEGTVTYFDSYGKPVDHALTYASKTAREELGETHKYLSQLFNRAPEEVVYNPINYQSEDPGARKGVRQSLSFFCVAFNTPTGCIIFSGTLNTTTSTNKLYYSIIL